MNLTRKMNMQIQVQEKEDLKVEVQYIADPEKVSEVRETIAQEVLKEASSVAIPGYRKGKAPPPVIRSRFRKLIDERTQQKLINQASEDIVFQTKMKTMFTPQILHSSLNNSHFECNLLFLKKPDITLKNYKNIQIPKPHIPKSAEQLSEEMLQDLRLKYGEVVPFQENDFVERNTKITMDVKCSVNGTDVPLLTKEGEFYTVGHGYYEDFDDNILGMSVGEERSFDLLWDKEKQEHATFTVKVHMGVKNMPAPLDDALAEKLGFESLEKLRAYVTSVASNKIKQYEKQQVSQQVMLQLHKEHDFEIPQWLIELDSKQLASQHGMQYHELDANTKRIVEVQSKERLKNSLLFDALREAEPELQLSPNEMIEVLKVRLQEQGQDANKYLVEAQNSGKLLGIIAALQKEATVEWLCAQAQIVE